MIATKRARIASATLPTTAGSGSAHTAETDAPTRRIAPGPVNQPVHPGLQPVTQRQQDERDGRAWRVGLVLAAFVLTFTTLVFGLVVRRVLGKNSARASAWTALVLGVLAVASLAVFWLALPPVFAVAALALARDARDRRPFRGEALAVTGAVLAVLGMVAAFAVTAIG